MYWKIQFIEFLELNKSFQFIEFLELNISFKTTIICPIIILHLQWPSHKRQEQDHYN